ncbi:unnamed protein product [Lota lota]
MGNHPQEEPQSVRDLRLVLKMSSQAAMERTFSISTQAVRYTGVPASTLQTLHETKTLPRGKDLRNPDLVYLTESNIVPQDLPNPISIQVV